MITELSPPMLLNGPVAACAVTFDLDEPPTAAAARLDIPLPARLVRAVDKRAMEYVAGRYCARKAMRRLGVSDASAPGMLPDRSPQWPKGMLGAITHTTRFAWAAAARDGERRGIGIDSEALPAAAREEAIRSVVLTEAEHALLTERLAPAWGSAAAAVAAFSAKESIYKCLVPATGVRLVFRDAVVSDADPDAGTITLYLTRDIAPGLKLDTPLVVRCAVDSKRVYTALAWCYEDETCDT